MGFSLVGFGAGLAESAIERIEEERKFSNLALQGRIERASVLKMQRDKEADALMKELREQKESLQQYGIDDPEVQKAYLTAPTLAEALKKSLTSGQVKIENANQYAREFAKINLAKLPTGTVDEFIANAGRAARGGGEVEPARVMPTEGGSIFAPSVSGQQRRLQQLASARGMTLEEVARAESATAPSRPEVAASINLEMLRRPEKGDVDDVLKKLQKEAVDAAVAYGDKDERTVAARARFQAYAAKNDEIARLKPEQLDHRKRLDQAMGILSDPNSTEEQKAPARKYVDNYQREKNRLEAMGKPNDKMPSESVMRTSMERRAATAVLYTYGSRVGEDFAEVTREMANPDDPGKTITFTDLRYIGKDPKIREEIIQLRQKAAISYAAAEISASGGLVRDRNLRGALSAFAVDFTPEGKPILVGQEGSTFKAQPGSSAQTTSVSSTPQRSPTTAPPPPVGQRTGRTITPAPAARPTTVARPTTQAEFDALPKGARYINPADNQEYIKN